MEPDNHYTNGRSGSNDFDSVTTAAREVHQIWSFARPSASQSSSQLSDLNFQTPVDLENNTDQMTPFSFRNRSLEVPTAQSPQADEKSLLRARRHDSHKSSRLLDPNPEQGHRTSRSVSETLLIAHTPSRMSSFVGHADQGAGTSQPESRPSHAQDQKSFSRHPQVFPVASRYHTPTKRKSLSERLQEPPKPSRLYEPPNNLSQTPSHGPTLPVEHNLTSSLPAAADHLDTDMALDLDGSECVTVPNSKTNPRSRSASVSSSTILDPRGMQSVVMEAMKTIHRFESENEIQRGEIERLNNNVALLEKEKEKLSNKVQLVKNASLQKLSASSQSLENLRVDLAFLKSESHAITPVSLAEIQEMKTSISHALSASEKYLENGVSVLGSAERTREVVNELKLDCVNKQQVLDMLRDRLTDALSDLASSKNRVFELEDAYATDKLALKTATEQLTTTGSRISELASALKQQQKESVDVMVSAGELEQQLTASKAEVLRLGQLVADFEMKATDSLSLQTRISELKCLVDSQTDKLETLDSTRKENIQLKAVVKERDNRIIALEEGLSDLSAVRERNTRLETLVDEGECKQNICDGLAAAKDSAILRNMQLQTQLDESVSKSKMLELELSTRIQLVEELRTSMGMMQANFDNSCQLVKKLEAELASSLARESSCRAGEASEKAYRLEETRLKTANAEQLAAAEHKLQGLLVQAAMHEKRLQEANARLQSLQERFEEQSITLRLTRDTSAELQDRLVAAESGYAKSLEADSGGLRIQIAVLQEQNATLQAQLEQHTIATERQRTEYMTKEAALIQRVEVAGKDNEVKCSGLRTEIAVLREQNSACRAQLKQIVSESETHRVQCTTTEADMKQRIEEARKDLDREARRASDMKIQADRELAEVTLRNDDLKSRLASVQEQLQAVPAPCTVHEEEIAKSTAQASRFRLECDAMKERSRSLNYRYDKGDLDPEERTLIKTIIDATQSMHDRELARAQNELNRSNKLIGTLQDAKTSLENSLAKHLAEEAKLKAAVTKAGTSVVEFVHWPSSQLDVSMEGSVPPAQDKDAPSTAPEEPPGGEENYTTPVLESIQVPDSPDRPLASLARFSTPESSSRNFALPPAGLSKPYFSTLAPDQSDEIVEFEDEPTGAQRKKGQSEETAKIGTSKPAKRTKTAKASETQVQTTAEPVKTTYASKAKRKRR